MSPVDWGCWVENEVLRIPCSQTIRDLDHPLTRPQTVRNRDHLLTGLVGICSWAPVVAESILYIRTDRWRMEEIEKTGEEKRGEINGCWNKRNDSLTHIQQGVITMHVMKGPATHSKRGKRWRERERDERKQTNTLRIARRCWQTTVVCSNYRSCF